MILKHEIGDDINLSVLHQDKLISSFSSETKPEEIFENIKTIVTKGMRCSITTGPRGEIYVDALNLINSLLDKEHDSYAFRLNVAKAIVFHIQKNHPELKMELLPE